MAYLKEYEEIQPKIIGNRQIPPLRKYYRADGSFDLFMTCPAPLMLRKLTQEKWAGIAINHASEWCNYGDYAFSVENDNGNNFDYMNRTTFVGGKGWTRACLKLRLDNPYGLTVRDCSVKSTGKGSGKIQESYLYYYNGSRTGNLGVTYNSLTTHVPPDYKEYKEYVAFCRFYDNDSSNSYSRSQMQIRFMKRLSPTSDLVKAYYT